MDNGVELHTITDDSSTQSFGFYAQARRDKIYHLNTETGIVWPSDSGVGLSKECGKRYLNASLMILTTNG